MKKSSPKLKQAAALKYDGENAPTLVAKGSGKVAQSIIDKAKQHNVHIHNDPVLLEVLGRLELGDEIPHSLYLAVAKIIAFAYYLQGKHPEYQASPDNNQDRKIPLLDASAQGDSKSNDSSQY